MIGLALVEMPVNRLAFELFFQDSPPSRSRSPAWSAPC